MSENYKSPYRELKLNARARPKQKREKVIIDLPGKREIQANTRPGRKGSPAPHLNIKRPKV